MILCRSKQTHTKDISQMMAEWKSSTVVLRGDLVIRNAIKRRVLAGFLPRRSHAPSSFSGRKTAILSFIVPTFITADLVTIFHFTFKAWMFWFCACWGLEMYYYFFREYELLNWHFQSNQCNPFKWTCAHWCHFLLFIVYLLNFSSYRRLMYCFLMCLCNVNHKLLSEPWHECSLRDK